MSQRVSASWYITHILATWSSNYKKAQTFNGLIYFHPFFFESPSLSPPLVCASFCTVNFSKCETFCISIRKSATNHRWLLGKIFLLAWQQQAHQYACTDSTKQVFNFFACFIYWLQFSCFSHCTRLEFSRAWLEECFAISEDEREAKRGAQERYYRSIYRLIAHLIYAGEFCNVEWTQCLVRRFSLSFVCHFSPSLSLAECMTQQRMYDLLRAIPSESVQCFLQSF